MITNVYNKQETVSKFVNKIIIPYLILIHQMLEETYVLNVTLYV